jgi:uncharacterized protein YhaN
MIISEIHIDGFGMFNSFSIKNLNKGINILFGENEAGKSTLLKFFKYTLFGYPRFKDQRMPPVNGGSHGGRIKAILSTNREVVFERKGDDKISLFYDGNTSNNENQWLQFLGNATKEIYENVFAFSLEELVGINSLSVSGVEDKIFSIGSGMGNISIGEVINDIQGSIDQIYSPRGSKQFIPAVFKTIQDKKSEIKVIQENLPIYQEMTAAIREIADVISGIEESLKQDRNRKEKLEDYLKCYVSFVSVVSADEELAGLPEPQEDYPKDGLEKLNVLEKEEKDLNGKIEELQKGSTGDKGIEEIEKELESISFNSEILKEKLKVNYLKTNLEKYKQTISDRSETSLKRDDLNSAIIEKLKAINSGWIEQNIIDFANILPHQDRIKNFKEKLESIKNVKIELEGQKKILLTSGSRINLKIALILISLVFLLVSVPVFYYSLNVAGIICVAIALLIFFCRRYLIKESPVDKIDKELSDIRNMDKEMQENFGNYLEKDLNLKRTLSADSALEILNTVSQLKKDINERGYLDRKQKETRDPFIKDFEDIVKSVGDLLGDKEDNSGIETLLSQITGEYDSAEEQSNKKEKLIELLSRKKKELEKNQNKLAKNSQSVSDLLKLVNAASRDELRKKCGVNNKILELTEKRRNAVNTIETIAGINMADDVIDFLKVHEQGTLRKDVADLEASIDLMTGELSSRNKELGEIKGRIKTIAGESELAGKMTELETEKQKLTSAYKEWMTGKIALKIFTEVREKYEKEKQPVIIQNSGRYFKKITGGRYERIHAALEKREIIVFDPREASKTIDQLSRGTREQLLVSLRLGFIEEYETNAEPLPVVVDDILVNFDPKRAQKTADIFREFAKNRQVIIFTCHPSTKDYFKKSPVNIIELMLK